MLNFRKLNAKAGQDEGEERPARAAAASSSPKGANSANGKPDPWYGRKVAPPQPGSDYGEFLEWATEGGPEWPGAVNLAIKLWMGIERQPEEPRAAPAP